MKASHFKPQWWAHSLFSKIAVWLADLFSDVKVVGLENIPRKGGALLICNHLSYFDAVALAAALDRSKRDTMVLAKAELFESKVLGTVLRSVGTIPVYRGTAQASDSLKEASNSLSHGEIVAMFPEGTIPKDGQLLNFKTGAARLALETNVPVIPMAMVGTNKIIASNLKKVKRNLWKSLWRIPSITILIGKPIQLTGDVADQNDVKNATVLLRKEVADLLEELEPKRTASPQVDKKGAVVASVFALPLIGLFIEVLWKRAKK